MDEVYTTGYGRVASVIHEIGYHTGRRWQSLRGDGDEQRWERNEQQRDADGESRAHTYSDRNSNPEPHSYPPAHGNLRQRCRWLGFAMGALYTTGCGTLACGYF